MHSHAGPNRTSAGRASASVAQNRRQRAAYVVLTWERGAWQIEHRRIPFDIEAIARDYAAVGYPDAQQAAQRLLKARCTWDFSTGSQA